MTGKAFMWWLALFMLAYLFGAVIGRSLIRSPTSSFLSGLAVGTLGYHIGKRMIKAGLL